MEILTAESKCPMCEGELNHTVRTCDDLSLVQQVMCPACRLIGVIGDDQLYPVDSFNHEEMRTKLRKRAEHVRQAERDLAHRFTEVRSS